MQCNGDVLYFRIESNRAELFLRYLDVTSIMFGVQHDGSCRDRFTDCLLVRSDRSLAQASSRCHEQGQLTTSTNINKKRKQQQIGHLVAVERLLEQVSLVAPSSEARSSINQQQLASDESRSLGREECNRGSNLLGPADATDRERRTERVDLLGFQAEVGLKDRCVDDGRID